MAAIKILRPQAGPQEAFLSTSADIAIYGGAAGGGKSWGLLMEPLRHVHNKEFGAVVFRRTTPQIRNEGGLWDESVKLYQPTGATPVENVLKWKFESGAKLTMSHLEYDKTVLNYQGSQIPLIMFDELTHFTAKQFWYMVSRNRSMCGVRPYIRATTNPDADSWVATFIEWWIDPKTGYPIPERSGVIRWFVRLGDNIKWASSPDELSHHVDINGVSIPPKSATFIGAKLTDNAALMKADPNYIASLMALPTVDRERLLGGNWKIRPAAGLYFQRSWVTVVDAVPSDLRECRGWDFAATPKTPTNDPDFTSGTKVGLASDGRIFVTHSVADQLGSLGVERLLMSTAISDGKDVRIALAQDPGAAGKAYVATQVKMLAGYNVRSKSVTGDKITRFNPFSAQAEAGNVFVLRGPWNEAWFQSLEGFPTAKHDDEVDSTSEAYNTLIGEPVHDGPMGFIV